MIIQMSLYRTNDHLNPRNLLFVVIIVFYDRNEEREKGKGSQIKQTMDNKFERSEI